MSTDPSSIETQAAELERWTSGIRINPRALRAIGDPNRRSVEMLRSLTSIVDAALLRARESAEDDPFRAAMIIALVQRVRTDNAELFRKLQAGESVTPDEYNALWRTLLTVTSQMGDTLPNTDEARQTVHTSIPGGDATRLPTARGERRQAAPRSSSPAARSDDDSGAGGFFLALGIFGVGAGIAAASRARRGRA